MDNSDGTTLEEQLDKSVWEEEKAFRDPRPAFCLGCGIPITQNPKGRPRKFCSDACRFKWKNKHPAVQNWKSARPAVCPVCGKTFIAAREYERLRKYCSRACANRGRRKEAAERIEK